jgi:DNA-binding XRE family transcriptional regulator
MIEKGERTLSLDIAFKIAEHYRISVEELLFRSDIGERCDQPTAVFTLEAIKEFMDIICPIIRSDVADSNQQFKQAYRLHKSIFEEVRRTGETHLSQFERCIDLYIESWRTFGIVESAANLLNLLMLAGIEVSDIDAEKVQNKLVLMKGLDFSAIRKFYLKNAEDVGNNEDRRKRFLDRNWRAIVVCLADLRQSERWRDLGEYYLAMYYFWGVVKGELSVNEYRLIGAELLEMYDALGNEYAKRFFDFLESALEN